MLGLEGSCRAGGSMLGMEGSCYSWRVHARAGGSC